MSRQNIQLFLKYAIRVNKFELSVYVVRLFMAQCMYARLRGPNNLLT